MVFHCKRAVIAAGAIAIAVGVVQPAAAVTLDFIGLIDNNPPAPGERAVEANPTANPLYKPPYVTIPTYAFGYAGNAATGITGSGPYAYLDGNHAGIGVCKTLTSTLQCNPSNDDNLTSGEILGLSWDMDLRLEEISFRGESHPNDPQFGGGDLFDISYDGGASWLTGQHLVNARFGTSFDTGGVFIPGGTQVLLAYNNEQYYVSALEVSKVPLPASALLLLGALGGLGVVGRRRKEV